MKPVTIKDWIRALRSGKYRQGAGALRVNGPRISYYCCLGVLGELHKKRDGKCNFNNGYLRTKNGGETPYKWAVKLGLGMTEQRILGSQNDQGCSFRRIATWIEKHTVKGKLVYKPEDS